MGQLGPGDTIRFYAVSNEDARALRAEQDEIIQSLISVQKPFQPEPQTIPSGTAVIEEFPSVTIRPSGESHLLIEYGPMTLDLNLRFKAHVVLKLGSTMKLRQPH